MAQEFEAHDRAADEMSGRTSPLLSLEEGAPLRRGPHGLLARLFAPEVQVWARPLGRVTGMIVVLGCVAFLGKQSEEETTFGARVPLPNPVAEEVAPDVPHGHEEEGSAERALAQAAPAPAEPPPCSDVKAADVPSGILADGRIIMNEATQSDFTRLPGVGEARAAKIIELRTRMGKFKQVADLLRVRGIGWKTLQSMKDQLVVDRPVEQAKPESEKEPEKNSEPPVKDAGASKSASS